MYFSRKVRLLAFEYFISRRTLKSVIQGKKVSKPIIRISVISIVLAVVVNLITIAVVTGFQQEVRQKVSGFGSHIFIMNATENSIYEAEPIRKDQDFISGIANDEAIKSISPVGYKPVLFQSGRNKISYKLANGKDTSELHQSVQGSILKGVDEYYDLSFYKKYLISGKLPAFSKDSISNDILISNKLAKDLQFKVGDEVSAFFVRNNPIMRKFNIVGIYETGLDEFDKKIVIGDLKYVQQLNDWGIQSSIEVEDTMFMDQLLIKATVFGGNGNYRCDWGEGYESFTRFTLCPIKDTTIRLITSDYWGDINASADETTIPDTSFLNISISGTPYSPCNFRTDKDGHLLRNYLNKTGSTFQLTSPLKTVTFESINGKGSSNKYVGGFEITLKNWGDLDESVARIKKKIEFIPSKFNELLKVTSIKESQNDIFVWLGFLDINVVIILTLMILIGIINMGSALLVLILIRTNFIGQLKSMGATNWSIRKIFLIQAAYLIGRGMLIGNVIGLSLCFIQEKYGVLQLNAEVYYLSQVPIELNWMHWLLLNVATLLVCLSALLLPSIVISRISPVKAIKFQ